MELLDMDLLTTLTGIDESIWGNPPLVLLVGTGFILTLLLGLLLDGSCLSQRDDGNSKPYSPFCAEGVISAETRQYFEKFKLKDSELKTDFSYLETKNMSQKIQPVAGCK